VKLTKNKLQELMWEVIDEEKKECPDDKGFEHKGFGFYAKKGEKGEAQYVRADNCKYYKKGGPEHREYIKSMRGKKEKGGGSTLDKVKQGIKQTKDVIKKGKEDKGTLGKSVKNWFKNLKFLK
tara:strand:+ start:160 stop:528 length:369 start_codon:yes stop_codon:yes gene_type:complete